MDEQQQLLTVGEFRRTIESLGRELGQRIESQSLRIDGLAEKVDTTNGRLLNVERESAAEKQKVVNLEREVFRRRHAATAPTPPDDHDGGAKPLTRRDLNIAVAVVIGVVAVLEFLSRLPRP